MRAGLDRAELLGLGHGFVEASAGVSEPWGGPLTAFARLEAGMHPLAGLTLYAAGQADLVGVRAEGGARVDF